MAPLFAGLEEHLAVTAVLQGAAQGRVWADNPQDPQGGVLWTAHRVFVAGSDAAALNPIVQEIAAEAGARGDWGMGVYGPAATPWRAMLAGLTSREMEREYWTADDLPTMPPAGSAAQPPPLQARAGLRLRTVDAALLAEEGLGRLEQLRAEMCSERASVADFLARSFGVCLVDEGEHSLAGWCLSEYNCGAACEVGIEVVEAHQRRGLGTLLTRALCAEAARRGITQVGWHCLADNEASRATARRAGLRLVKQYRAAVVLLAQG